MVQSAVYTKLNCQDAHECVLHKHSQSYILVKDRSNAVFKAQNSYNILVEKQNLTFD